MIGEQGFRDLMAALVRGGWVIPEEADRSMFLVAIIGTGPMKGRLSAAEVEKLMTRCAELIGLQDLSQIDALFAGEDGARDVL